MLIWDISSEKGSIRSPCGFVRQPKAMITFCKDSVSSPFSHGHPPEQKVPKSTALIRWYMELLKEAHSRGIVTEVSSLFDAFLSGRFNST